MPNVLVDKEKIDLLANAISAKSGEALTLTLDEMVDAVDGIETGGGGITPTGNIDITSAGVTDVTNYATATVATATINDGGNDPSYSTVGGARKWSITPWLEFIGGYVSGEQRGTTATYNAIAKNTSVTPTESAQTIGGANYMMEGAVTVNAIPSNYVGSAITSRTSSDLSASGATVTAPAGFYSSSASTSVQAGSATASASKGTVTNHSITVTPMVTRSAGYITAGTANGTAVTVSASELVSGTLSITANTTGQDVTNYKYVDVTVSGGGGGSTTVGTTTKTLSAAASSIQFTGLSGQPTSFVITSTTEQTTGGTKVVGVVYDGMSCHGMDITSEAAADTGFSQSYNNGTLTVTGTTASFQATTYKLVYSYGGSSADVGTVDVQVGSGATSITFTGLTDEPIYWSCVFKSSFSTSSGYQRTMMVANDGSSTYGFALDSSAKALTSWSASYSAGSLVITSTGTNDGGYFHQPGYYQLTYAVGEAPPITVEALNVTQNGTYTAPTGKAYSPVNVTVSGGGIGDLLSTTAIGAYSTSSTQATSMNMNIAATNVNGYDVLLVETSVDTKVANRHTATVGVAFITNSTNAATKNAAVMANAKWNAKLSSSSVTQTTSSTTAYGIYPNSCTVTTTSNGTATFAMYARYNSTRSGTINGTYTARVYGIKLCDLIGG